MKGNSGRQSTVYRAHRRTGQRRNKRGQKMMSSPELDTAAAGCGWKEAAQWYSLCLSLNNVSGGTQISKHTDLLGTPQFISSLGCG